MVLMKNGNQGVFFWTTTSTAAAAATAVFVSVAGATIFALLKMKRKQQQQQQEQLLKKILQKRQTFPPYHHPETIPTFIKILAYFPRPIRRYLAIKSSKPTPPTDGCDILGTNKYNPYTKKELVKGGKLWRVRYETISNWFELVKGFKLLFDIDCNDEATILNRTPNDEIRKLLKNDIRIINAIEESISNKNKNKNKSDKDLFDAGMVWTQDMLVVKLDDNDSNSNGLLLYNPCRMHPPMIEWLKSLGTVEWIVSGSSAHTNQIQQAANAFPMANIMCSMAANLKCQSVGMRCADYIYTDFDGIRAARKILEPRGVELYHIEGDIMTQALVIIAHKHLLEVDLVYGHHTEYRSAQMDSKEANAADVPIGHRMNRILYYSAFVKGASYTGSLPDYRIMAMDPSSPITNALFCIDDFPNDGTSSFAMMEESLRAMLHLDFQFVDSAHSIMDASMDAEDFRKSIDKNWNWLNNGRSLLCGI